MGCFFTKHTQTDVVYYKMHLTKFSLHQFLFVLLYCFDFKDNGIQVKPVHSDDSWTNDVVLIYLFIFLCIRQFRKE